MAPIDRQQREQRRLERMRGAGISKSDVIANFTFDFGLASKAAKESSAPPQRSQRTPTPRQQTPRAINTSARRHRSASVRGSSSSARRHATPKTLVVTPQLGKRKRGSKNAQASETDGEPDELSPEQHSETHSIERPRRVVGTVSPIREEVDDEPDELTIMFEGASGLPKRANDTPSTGAIPTGTPAPPGSIREKSSSASRAKQMSIRSRLSARRSKSAEAPPETPSVLSRARHGPYSAWNNVLATPNVVPEEDEEDELTPAQATVTPRVVVQQATAQVISQQEEEEIDELSSPAQFGNVAVAPTPAAPKEQSKKPNGSALAKRGRPKRIVVDEDDEVQSTPAITKPRRDKTKQPVQESEDAEDSPDELSPDTNRMRNIPMKQKQAAQTIRRQEEPIEISSEGEGSAEEEPTIRAMPVPKEKPAKRTNDQRPRKRPKFKGPKQAISVMRIKGSTVRGITVADTTRTILEENIDHQVQRMAAKMQTTEDSSRRKKLRGHINLALSFKESLIEKLMDLQDANDTLSAGFKKRKLLKKDNAERRREILTIQNSRHELALEMDDERAIYDTEKEKAEVKSKLSANMFAIQAAIQSGRARARKQGREAEGPERPLTMLLDAVADQVGSVRGGLLTTLQQFNHGLERAAGWLEGRA